MEFVAPYIPHTCPPPPPPATITYLPPCHHLHAPCRYLPTHHHHHHQLFAFVLPAAAWRTSSSRLWDSHTHTHHTHTTHTHVRSMILVCSAIPKPLWGSCVYLVTPVPYLSTFAVRWSWVVVVLWCLECCFLGFSMFGFRSDLTCLPHLACRPNPTPCTPLPQTCPSPPFYTYTPCLPPPYATHPLFSALPCPCCPPKLYCPIDSDILPFSSDLTCLSPFSILRPSLWDRFLPTLPSFPPTCHAL